MHLSSITLALADAVTDGHPDVSVAAEETLTQVTRIEVDDAVLCAEAVNFCL